MIELLEKMIKTNRLRLRNWREEDLAPFAEMSSDAELMRYFPSTLTRAESDELANRQRENIDRQGWGIWAVELLENGQFIGLTGLQHQPDRFAFSPCTEMAWRIARPYWGKGYATEAAMAALEYGFSTLSLSELVAFAVAGNQASISVMEKIGMTSDGDTFLHPEMPVSHPLAEHVLYRIANPSPG